jgi:thiol-disulfide isomerase/thioredoxin
VPSAKKRQAIQREARRRQLRLWGIVGGAVVLIAIVAIALSRGGGSQDGGTAQTYPVAVTGETLPPFPTAGSDPAVGMQAPTLTGTSLEGQPVTIDPGSTGSPTAIWFIAHWCPHCQAEVPRIVSLDDAGSLPTDVDIFAVSTGVDPSAPNYPPSAWLEDVGWPFPDMADDDAGTAGVAYGLGSFPYLVLIDADGNVVARHAGELGEDGIVQAMDALQ